MSLCKLMVMDYQENIGRIDPDLPNERLRFDNLDLHFGIGYCEGLLEFGYKKEPFYNFDLSKFIVWAKEKLEEHGNKN